ncbi:MAG: hypothetical protein D6689_21955 [Deltaproteobacteria bacterium]|nr:MAG: hypothetical protein D6689_21955 [Deltaproteobacteria bacterium]
MRLRSLVAAAAALLVAGPAAAQRAKPAKPACGIQFLPLAEGNYWVFEPINQPPAGPPPAKVKIEVVKVEPQGKKAATITLKETYRDVEFEMKATCDAAQLVLPPESFFFAAEPGGVSGMQIEGFEHKGASFPAKGLKPGDQWFEEIRFDVVRVPAEGSNATHDPAKVELERLTTVTRGQQLVDTAFGPFKAQVVEFEIRGRGIIGEKSQEIPVRDKGILWFSKRIGLSRARDVSGREWQLVDTNLVAKNAP